MLSLTFPVGPTMATIQCNDDLYSAETTAFATVPYVRQAKRSGGAYDLISRRYAGEFRQDKFPVYHRRHVHTLSKNLDLARTACEFSRVSNCDEAHPHTITKHLPP